MKVDIITIGDEILIGQIVDTNSAWMSQRLGEIGASVRRKYSVGDVASEIRGAIEESLSVADVVITTGGLAPPKTILPSVCWPRCLTASWCATRIPMPVWSE